MVRWILLPCCADMLNFGLALFFVFCCVQDFTGGFVMNYKVKRILRDLYYVVTDFLVFSLTALCFVCIWWFCFL